MIMHDKVSEYDQEMPQSQTADQPTAPEENTRNTDSHNTIGSKATNSLFLSKVIAKLERAPQNKDPAQKTHAQWAQQQ